MDFANVLLPRLNLQLVKYEGAIKLLIMCFLDRFSSYCEDRYSPEVNSSLETAIHSLSFTLVFFILFMF